MRREFLLSLILASMLLIPVSSAQTAPNRLACSLTTSCDALEVMRLSADTNAHGQTAATGTYPQIVCCVDSQGGAIQGLGTSCSAPLSDTVLRLSATTNAHAQTPDETGYSTDVCLSVDGNPSVTNLECTSATTSCPTGYTTLVSLSSADNTHLAKPSSTIYTTKICCRVNMDDTPPTGLGISYIDGFYNSLSAYTVTVNQGTDPETGIVSVQLFMKTAPLNGGTCGTFGSWTPYGTQSPGTTSIPVTVTTGTCYMFNYSSTNGAQLTSYVTSQNRLRVDRLAPVTTDNFVGGTYGGTVDGQLFCTDSQGSGCKDTFYCTYNTLLGEDTCHDFTETDGSVSVTCGEEECSMVVRYFSTDNAGNSENVKNTTDDIIHINKNLPWCSFTAPDPQAGYTNDSYITLEWEGDDPGGSGITYNIKYRKDSSSWISLTNGEVTYTEYAGNFESNHLYDFQCIVTNEEDETGQSGILTLFVDSTPPVSSLTATPAWTTGNATVQWVGDDFGGSGIDSFTIQKNTGSGWLLWKEYGTEGSAEYEFQETESTVRFRVRAVDNAFNTGVWSEESATRLDNTPPTCTLDELDVYQNHNSFPVSWSGTDLWEGAGSSLDVGGKIYYTVQYSTNQQIWTTLPGAGGTEDTTKSMPGQDSVKYYFRCMGEDSAGNEGSWSATKSTTVDSSPPDISNLKYNSSVAKDEQNNISVRVSDAAGIESVVLSIDNNDIDPSAEDKDVNEWDLVWYVMALDIGTKTAKITVTDINGNSLEKTFNFTIKACIEGEVRECDPRDPNTGNTYSEGVCRHTGIRTCSGGMWSECTGGKLPSVEECNLKDDDCDGDKDESGSGGLLVKACGTDAGVCSAGLMTCIDGNWSSCAGEEGPNPEGEICGNNLDDDCNGVADEDCACEEGDTQPCGESNVGECLFGIQTCENGKMSMTCIGNIDPVDEICDNLKDDDCDGYKDCEDSDCSLDSSCAGQPEVPEEPFPIGNVLMLLGIIVMGVLLALWYFFKRAGQELTWEALIKKWVRR